MKNIERKKENDIKVLSLFSGIGALEKALSRLNIDYELVNYCEIDKYASKAFSLIHNVSEELNLGDITQVNAKTLPNFDLMNFSFPCTNISIANKENKGLEGESSGLYYKGLNVLQEKKPKYSIIENVDNLASKKYKPVLDQILKDLEEAGYNNYYQILNAIDYGIPQHRRRLFIISIRKDINQNFNFPKVIPLNIKFEDLLEKEVSAKYYLSRREREYMDRKVKGGRDHWDFKHYHDTENTYSHCITANMYKGVPYNVLVDRRKCWRYDCDFIDQGREFCGQCTDGDSFQGENYPTSGIRKMIPLECFRLMGFDDNDYNKLKDSKISDTQLFKMAGNSIVVNVLEEIFKKLFKKYGTYIK